MPVNHRHKKTQKKSSSVQGNKKSSLIRLNKFISNSGVCSRREADLFISIGNVTVNGKVVTEMDMQPQASYV